MFNFVLHPNTTNLHLRQFLVALLPSTILKVLPILFEFRHPNYAISRIGEQVAQRYLLRKLQFSPAHHLPSWCQQIGVVKSCYPRFLLLHRRLPLPLDLHPRAQGCRFAFGLLGNYRFPHVDRLELIYYCWQYLTMIHGACQECSHLDSLLWLAINRLESTAY